VQALAGVANQCSEALLDIEVHVFKVERPDKMTGFDFALDDLHATLDLCQIVIADDALLGQHLGVGQRAANVLTPHALVEID
jgi:hypothetical protein